MKQLKVGDNVRIVDASQLHFLGETATVIRVEGFAYADDEVVVRTRCGELAFLKETHVIRLAEDVAHKSNQ